MEHMEIWSLDRIKRDFFQTVEVFILLYRCTTWTLTKYIEEKLNGNYTRMLSSVLKKLRNQHPTKQQVYGHWSSITRTIQVRRTKHAGYCWKTTFFYRFLHVNAQVLADHKRHHLCADQMTGMDNEMHSVRLDYTHIYIYI